MRGQKVNKDDQKAVLVTLADLPAQVIGRHASSLDVHSDWEHIHWTQYTS
jgi:hypothetical protein